MDHVSEIKIIIIIIIIIKGHLNKAGVRIFHVVYIRVQLQEQGETKLGAFCSYG